MGLARAGPSWKNANAAAQLSEAVQVGSLLLWVELGKFLCQRRVRPRRLLHQGLQVWNLFVEVHDELRVSQEDKVLERLDLALARVDISAAEQVESTEFGVFGGLGSEQQEVHSNGVAVSERDFASSVCRLRDGGLGVTTADSAVGAVAAGAHGAVFKSAIEGGVVEGVFVFVAGRGSSRGVKQRANARVCVRNVDGDFKDRKLFRIPGGST